MEGFFDVIRASTIGVNNCIATMGTAFTTNHANLLKKITNNIILCFDGDQAGEEATTKAIKVLEQINVTPKIIRLEEKDPDEYILKRGKDAFLNKITKAISVVEFKMQLLKQNHNLNDITEVTAYLEDSLKELAKTKDEILVELTLQKMSKEYNITYDTLKTNLTKYQKQLSLNTNSNSNFNLKLPSQSLKKDKFDKYAVASRNLLFSMLQNSDIITFVSQHLASIPDEKERMLYNEIIYYYEKYGTLSIADFITYISLNNNLIDLVKEILATDPKTSVSKNEIEDYIQVINSYNKETKINNLQLQLKQEVDPLKQTKILKEIMEIRGVRP